VIAAPAGEAGSFDVGTAGSITIEAVSRAYEVKSGSVLALENVSFRVGAGQFVVLIGPSGCGKSTLLHCIGGFIPPTSGRILLDGAEIRTPGPDRGIVFQRESLFPWMTIEGNLKTALRPKRIVGAEADRLCTEYLGAVGLSGFGGAYPHQLSGGMQQRAAIARTLIYQPSVLLLDEPLGALDAQTRELMKEWVLDIWLRERKTVVYVTHDLDEAVFLGQKVIVLTNRPGRVKFAVDIALAYPRDRRDPHYEEVREQLWQGIREEVRFA
jgi:ABC-type nitrate/sulfonate/bicarbonate transport system ATPase subunit